MIFFFFSAIQLKQSLLHLFHSITAVHAALKQSLLLNALYKLR